MKAIEQENDLNIIKQHKKYKKECIKSSKIYGGVWMNYLMYYFIPVLIGSPLFSYYMATKYKEARGYPHTTITNMSRFYPQDLVFRFFMLPSGAFVNLIYLVLFAWVKRVKNDAGYPGTTQQWLMPLGHLSVIGYMFAIGTIDAGPLPFIHITGALVFFLMLFSITISQTITLMDMHSWCSSIIRTQSLIIKVFIASYLMLVFVYSLLGALMQFAPSNEDDKYMVIFEWNLILGCLLWLFTFCKDWGNIYLTLKIEEERLQEDL